MLKKEKANLCEINIKSNQNIKKYMENSRKIKLENSIKKNNADEQADKITKELIEKIDKVL